MIPFDIGYLEFEINIKLAAQANKNKKHSLVRIGDVVKTSDAVWPENFLVVGLLKICRPGDLIPVLDWEDQESSPTEEFCIVYHVVAADYSWFRLIEKPFSLIHKRERMVIPTLYEGELEAFVQIQKPKAPYTEIVKETSRKRALSKYDGELNLEDCHVARLFKKGFVPRAFFDKELCKNHHLRYYGK